MMSRRKLPGRRTREYEVQPKADCSEIQRVSQGDGFTEYRESVMVDECDKEVMEERWQDRWKDEGCRLKPDNDVEN